MEVGDKIGAKNLVTSWCVAGVGGPQGEGVTTKKKVYNANASSSSAESSI